jgi:hypothetical protein
MSVKTDASGKRSVHLEFEVPGTPEQVWQAAEPLWQAWTNEIFTPTVVEELS